MPSISFFNESVDFRLPRPILVRRALKRVIASEQCQLGTLTYIFCSDAYLLDLNVRYLGHDFFTDVITFDHLDGTHLPSQSRLIEGDIFISVERVRDKATTLGGGFLDELARVMVHGLLHLVGYDDRSEADTTVIRSKETEYLHSLFLV